ncbi:WD40 repeat-like protein [Pisolithus thermaeus]|nr:WD40 repeat-like protein [Pisolithus thermaeus]
MAQPRYHLDGSSDDSEGFEGPDAYLDGEDRDIELEIGNDDLSPVRGSRTTISQLLHSLFELQNSDSSRPVAQPDDSVDGRLEPGTLTFGDILRLSRSGGTAYSVDEFDEEEEEEDDDDYDDDYFTATRHGSVPWHEQWLPPHREPQREGLELLRGGEFGRVTSYFKAKKGIRNISRIFLDRSSRRIGPEREELAGDFIPNSNGIAVASHPANLYVGQFSKDSSFYYTCSQNFHLYVYDMTAPPSSYTGQRRGARRPVTSHWDTNDRDHETTLKVLKTIEGRQGSWTITDSHLSPNNERIIYSSITPIVYMTTTLDSSSAQTPIRFADQNRRNNFGIWSCRFSADGNEVIAGGSGHIFVYNLPANRKTVEIVAHADDVNSCCWADSTSGNVLVSASDDTFLKVWDRRSLGASRKPSGVLVGHTEGITNVSAKGDGRYIISNGKDQALRLWDLRKMKGSDEFDRLPQRNYRAPGYDYRYGHYPKPRRSAHPDDCSVMTYRGHAVLRTLVRCNFSPTETTGSKYIYSGSADGKIHIWSLDGRVVQVLDRAATLPMSYYSSGPEMQPPKRSRTAVCVRDVSWSSTEPVMMSVGWDDSRTGGSIVARHEWKGLSKMSYSLEDWTEKQRAEGNSSRIPEQYMFEVKSPKRPVGRFLEFIATMTVTDDTDAQLFGFPPGYFVIRSLATGRVWDVSADAVEDGTEVILWPEKEHSLIESLRNPDANNQVFFIDTSGALCSRASGHAIDVEDVERLVLRHRRPISKPYPNAYSHPLPQLSYNPKTREISVTFAQNPEYPQPRNTSSAWRRKTYVLSAVPMPKPRSLVDDASTFITSAVAAPLSFFSGSKNVSPKATPEDVFSGEIDLAEDEVLEQDRGEEGEADDSPELIRRLRVITIDPGDPQPEGINARRRRQWEILTLRTTPAQRRV